MIETARLRLRPVRLEDRDAIFRCFTPEVTRYMMPAAPKQPAETEEFLAKTVERMERGEELVCAVTDKETGAFLGCAGVHELKGDVVELGIWLAAEAQGRGLGIEAVSAMHAWASREHAPKAFLYPVDRDNAPSRRIAEKLGGEITGERTDTTADGRTLNTLEYRVSPLA